MSKPLIFFSFDQNNFSYDYKYISGKVNCDIKKSAKENMYFFSLILKEKFFLELGLIFFKTNK